MLCGLCFPADGPSGSLYLLLHLSLGSNCLNLYVWVLPDIFVLCSFHTSLKVFSQFSLFILILALSSLSSLLLSYSLSLFCYLSLEGEVNSCRNFSVRLTWLRLDGVEGSGGAAETRILSRFLLMTPPLLFTYSGSSFVFHFICTEQYQSPVNGNNNKGSKRINPLVRRKGDGRNNSGT